MTPPQRSATLAPVPEPEPEPTPAEELPPPLPKSISAGKPLPAVDSPQPDDLPSSEYQTVAERCVPPSQAVLSCSEANNNLVVFLPSLYPGRGRGG
jgi:hypothetical protein